MANPLLESFKIQEPHIPPDPYTGRGQHTCLNGPPSESTPAAKLPSSPSNPSAARHFCLRAQRQLTSLIIDRISATSCRRARSIHEITKLKRNELVVDELKSFRAE